MSEKLYHIEFSGKIIPGWDIDEVKVNLAKLLKANEEKLYQLFSGRRLIIKKNVDHRAAVKINDVLKAAGADCVITPAADSSAVIPPPLPSQSGSGQTHQGSTVAAKPALAPAGIRPGRLWYVVATLLLLILLIAGGITLFDALDTYFSGETRLTVPGETTIQANKPGTYLIYYETSAFTQSGIAHHQLGRDFAITVMDLATAEELPLLPVEIPVTENNGAMTLQAIAKVQFDASGLYSAAVIGEIPSGDGLVARRFDLVELVKGVIWAFMLFFLGVIVGPLMALVVLVKRQNYKRIHSNERISEKEEREWAMFAHIGTFSSMLVPLGNIIAPIVIWQLKKHDSDFVVEQAKESLNFQITLIIYALISFLLVFIIIGFFLIFVLVIFGLITVIIAGVKANDGEHYRYPMTLRLVK
jgi:uncharacterized protein